MKPTPLNSSLLGNAPVWNRPARFFLFIFNFFYFFCYSWNIGTQTSSFPCKVEAKSFDQRLILLILRYCKGQHLSSRHIEIGWEIAKQFKKDFWKFWSIRFNLAELQGELLNKMVFRIWNPYVTKSAENC